VVSPYSSHPTKTVERLWAGAGFTAEGDTLDKVYKIFHPCCLLLRNSGALQWRLSWRSTSPKNPQKGDARANARHVMYHAISLGFKSRLWSVRSIPIKCSSTFADPDNRISETTTVAKAPKRSFNVTKIDLETDEINFVALVKLQNGCQLHLNSTFKFPSVPNCHKGST